MLASWRDSTKQQYTSYLSRWFAFCSQRDQNPLQVSVTVVLDFLTGLFAMGLGYSALNTARSALSAVIRTDSGRTIGTHPAVVRFMKGVFELRTPTSRYQKTWDVSILLSYFKDKEANSLLTLKDLTMKLCALLLLTTAQILQTVLLMKLSCIQVNENGYSICFVDKLKTSRPGFQQPPLQLSRYSDEKLCVVKCLKEYILRTADLRSTDQLILCYQYPHGPASKDSISRWMKSLLNSAGIHNFGPHSFRGATSSAMLKSGISLEVILKTAGWAKASTFHKFYNKPLENKCKAQKANSILNFFAPKQMSD